MRALNPYPSELITVSTGMYTKHYYAGSSRIASRIGGGFVPHKDLNDYSPVATTDRVPLLQTSSYDHKAENLRNLWARAGECMGVSLEYAYSLESSGLYLNPTETADGERYFYHSDHLGSSAYITTENGYATQFLAYMPYGETLAEQQNGTSYYSPFKFSAKEKDFETGYSYFGARYYSPELSVWLSVDPMADKAPGWTPYRYGFNNPISFVDPDGRWEIKVEKDASGKNQMVVVGQKGDDLKSLSEQTGFSEKYLKRQLGDKTASSLGEGSRITAIGNRFDGINKALNEKDYMNSNCFGTALSLSSTGNVDPSLDIDDSFAADNELVDNYISTNSPQFGHVVRYSKPDGYTSSALSWGRRLMQPKKGEDVGGAIHFAIFLLKNGNGTQVFTKNGIANNWTIMYEHQLPASYGKPIGIDGQSPFYYRR